MLLKRKLSCILLVDDNPDDNYFHQLVINEMNIVEKVDVVTNGIDAISYLEQKNQAPPELIFLDINMPKMNGWEFLTEYKKLVPQHKARVVIMILSTSSNPDDFNRAKEIEEVSGFETKPLSKESLTEILQSHFKDYM